MRPDLDNGRQKIRENDMGEYTTIRITVELKKKLDSLKIYPRESYNNVIKRLVEWYLEEGSGFGMAKNAKLKLKRDD
jgi:predicted DNA-binding protein